MRKIQNKKGAVLGIVITLLVVLFVGMFSFIAYQQGWFSKPTPQSGINVNVGGNGNTATQGTVGQNPVVTLAFTNALTKQSITAGANNFRDVASGNLLGTSLTSFASGQQVIPMINATGYITEVKPQYSVISGNQQLTGTLYQFANASITIGKNLASGTSIGGTLGSTGNDTKFTTQANNQIILTGNTYKSSGRQFIIYELSTTTNVTSMDLTEVGSSTPLAKLTVPNCYTNTLTSPFRQAWEIPAVVGGVQKTYNLQTVSQNGNTVQGEAILTIYSEKDGIDTLTGDFLTSGICDSNNAFFNLDKQVNTFYYN